jgi:GNAT superfamily N-acetyltransferase
VIEPQDLFERALTLVDTDEHGRMQGRHSAHFYVLRTQGRVACRCHRDLPPAAISKLKALAARERGRPSAWSREYADYLGVLSAIVPVRAVRAGPLYHATGAPVADAAVLRIEAHNAELLRGGLDEWLPDVAAGLPMLATIEDGRAVSICTSVRATAIAHTAGVETVPDYRGRGLAAKTVAAWAAAVHATGATPFYATTFDNIASQGVARRLGLQLVGAEFSVECDR